MRRWSILGITPHQSPSILRRNDRVFNTIELYAAGLTPMEDALKKLQYEKPNNQICLLRQPLVDNYLLFIEAKQIEP